MRLMSISRVGRDRRIAIIGTSVCPPAMMRAFSSAASRAQASSMSEGREYSKGAAFMIVADTFDHTKRGKLAGLTLSREAIKGNTCGTAFRHAYPHQKTPYCAFRSKVRNALFSLSGR